MSISLSPPPERLADIIDNLRPAGSYVLQFALAHDGELAPCAAMRAPHPDAREDAPDNGECRT
jgi:hypothetical protein